MYVEELLQLIQDLPCDKGNKVWFDTYACGHEDKNLFTKDLLYVDENGDLHIDAAYN